MGTDHVFLVYLTCTIPDHRLAHAGTPCRIFAEPMDLSLSTCRAAPAWLSRAFPGTSSSEAISGWPVSMKTVTTSIS